MAFLIRERDTKTVIKKKNVYITGHGRDVSWFDTVANEILNLWDCMVYTDVRPCFEEELDEHLFSLKEMNLVVLVVTKSFLLESNPAREIEFEFIKEKKVPVLPILLEKDLERTFDSVCGDLHCLNRETSNYKEILREYLNSAFGDDELRGSVQKILKGKMFLSYRKKDREHALLLMHLIHQFEACGDLKVWYDDFLTLGEDYDEEIDYHLRTSDIFVLAVTPNLLEEGNYVMEMEYPRAISLKKKIIPVELIPTDREELQRKYPQLPECIIVRDVQSMEETFLKAMQELKLESVPASGEKDFLLGQAYLKGIDLEINRERGMALIKKAAKQNHFQAVYQLWTMYFNGEGVEKNLIEAGEWLEKSVELAQRGFDKESGVEWAVPLATCMLNLIDCYMNSNDRAAAKKMLVKFGDMCKWLWEIGYYGTACNPGNAWLRHGMICMQEEDYVTAMESYNKAEYYLKVMYQCNETGQSTKCYALILAAFGELYCRLFSMYENVCYLYKAVEYLEKAKLIQERFIEVYKQQEGIGTLSAIYQNLEYAYKGIEEAR